MLIETLAQFNNWIISGPDKVPYRWNARSEWDRASSTNASDWTDYRTALNALGSNPKPGWSLGFVLTNSPFTCIDLDTHKTEDVSIKLLHQRLFDRFNSATEISANGGLHIFVEGDAPARKVTDKCFEIYSTDRYIKITGKMFWSVPIANRQDLLDVLGSEIDRHKANNQPNMVEGQPQIEEDWEVLAKATSAKNGDKFKRLWSGDWRTDYSHKANATGTASSEADSALICFLAFHSKSRAQIARMFMCSGFGRRDKYSKASTHRRNYLINGMIDYALKNPDVIPAVDFGEALKKFGR